MTEGNQSLVGLYRIKGELCQKFQHTDGTVEYKSISDVEEESITDRFQETDTIPADWDPKTDEVLSKNLPKDDHIKRSCRLEAMMIKLFDGNTTTKDVDTKDNKVFKQILTDLCNILGGEWKDKIKEIK